MIGKRETTIMGYVRTTRGIRDLFQFRLGSGSKGIIGDDGAGAAALHGRAGADGLASSMPQRGAPLT